MSWCRWSSMDWRCDLYVYESEHGVEVNVAGRRHQIDYSLLPPRVEVQADPAGWLQRERLMGRLLDETDLVPIGLPYAGEYRTFDTLTDAADWCDELAALGYVMPDDMTSRMRAEEAEQNP